MSISEDRSSEDQGSLRYSTDSLTDDSINDQQKIPNVDLKSKFQYQSSKVFVNLRKLGEMNSSKEKPLKAPLCTSSPKEKFSFLHLGQVPTKNNVIPTKTISRISGTSWRIGALQFVEKNDKQGEQVRWTLNIPVISYGKGDSTNKLNKCKIQPELTAKLSQNLNLTQTLTNISNSEACTSGHSRSQGNLFFKLVRYFPISFRLQTSNQNLYLLKLIT